MQHPIVPRALGWDSIGLGAAPVLLLDFPLLVLVPRLRSSLDLKTARSPTARKLAEINGGKAGMNNQGFTVCGRNNG